MAPQSPASLTRLNKACFAQTLTKRLDNGCRLARRPAAQKTDHRHCRLLRPCRQRPGRRRAAEKGDDIAASHDGSLSLRATLAAKNIRQATCRMPAADRTIRIVKLRIRGPCPA